jgi:voltage-gated potassium channel
MSEQETMTRPHQAANRERLHRERWELVHHLHALTEGPMIAFSFVWLALLIIDFTRGLGPSLQAVSNIIWGLFIADFVLGLLIAPNRLTYVRHNWLTALALLLPALRVVRLVRAFRLLRAARAARSVALVRLLTTINRGMRVLGRTVGRRGIGYLVALTVIVTLTGAAGMRYFEAPATVGQASAGLTSYGEALWWTAMLMTTVGGDYAPRTAEGRLLAWLLALYALGVFSYLTATVASHFIGQDAAPVTDSNAEDAARLAEEVTQLRTEIAAFRAGLEAPAAHHRPDRTGVADNRSARPLPADGETIDGAQ